MEERFRLLRGSVAGVGSDVLGFALNKLARADLALQEAERIANNALDQAQRRAERIQGIARDLASREGLRGPRP